MPIERPPRQDAYRNTASALTSPLDARHNAMANFNANSANANATTNRTEFLNFRDKIKSMGAVKYEFRTVTTKRDPENPERRIPLEEPYRILLWKNEAGKFLDWNGKAVDSDESAAVFKLGKNTSAEMSYDEFTWDWVKSHIDNLVVGETVSQNGLVGYSMCLSTAVEGEVDL